LDDANLSTVEALAATVDAKDAYTRGHAGRVSGYAAAIAAALDLPAADIARIRQAGLLHDVGKIGVPDAILLKPSGLTDEEFACIKEHPAIGERILQGLPFLGAILPAVRHHHERWDGRGYPDGLAGAAIPPDAAILAVADSLDAMTSSRTYRQALPVAEAIRRVREGAGTQYDPRIVAAFDRALADKTLTLPPIRTGELRALPPRVDAVSVSAAGARSGVLRILR
jgi:HD-GYP domain-containing protein (c-di-GMP phosphodiesterase class II)